MDAKTTRSAAIAEETLDPADWREVKELSHRIVDDAVDYLSGLRERPSWREMPAEVKVSFETSLPHRPTPLADVYRQVSETVMPFPMGNVHPRFWAWYMGSGNYTGALAEFVAAVQGSNLGGGKHAAALVDRQVIAWLNEIVGFPATASGTLVMGGSVANLIGLAVARSAKADVDIREHGVGALDAPLRYYGSDQIHSCHRKAMETLGLGNRALRRVPTDDALRIDIAALRQAIASDRAAGFRPACVIANAGTVNTGAIDDLEALADLAAEEGLWFHVDGCIGALLAIAPDNAYRVAGLSRADSIALDPHKWLHAPFGVGCALIRDATAHHHTFAISPEYLESTSRGLASAAWLHEYGLDMSRPFNALKVWMALKEHGVEKFGRLIDQNVAQAHYLGRRIEETPRLVLVAPANINIVCYRYDPGRLDAAALKALNTEIMLRLQEEGTATLHDTTVHGEHCLRVAINNHRTRREDLDLLVAESVRLGDAITAGSSRMEADA